MPALKSAIDSLLHLFFPHVCTGCGSDVLDSKHQLCLHCLSQLPVTNFFEQKDNPVEKHFYGRLAIRNAAAGYFFTKDSMLQNLIHSLKYKGNKDIGVYLGKLMAKSLIASEHYNEIDALVPLPLNPRREKKRGYNQATAICHGIATEWNKPVLDKAIIRTVYTDTQTKKDRINRWKNMDGVFAIKDSYSIQNKHILLVDDVVTTGSSLEACGSEMLKVPGVTLSLATLACTA